MALYGCPDCGGPVSSESMTCPKCGWRQKRSFAPIGCSILAIVGLVCVFSFFYFAPDPKALAVQPREPSGQPALAHAQEQIAGVLLGAKNETLTPLISKCAASDCSDDIYQPVWRKIEADNGEVTKIDMKSIQRFNTGAVDVAIYTYVPHTPFDPGKLRRLTFDCAGHFMDDTEGFSPQMDAPPRSIAGQIASIVCTQ